MNDWPAAIFTMIVILFQIVHIKDIWLDGMWYERRPKQEAIQ